MDQFQLKQTAKLPSDIHNVFVNAIEEYKDVLIEHYIREGNTLLDVK